MLNNLHGNQVVERPTGKRKRAASYDTRESPYPQLHAAKRPAHGQPQQQQQQQQQQLSSSSVAAQGLVVAAAPPLGLPYSLGNEYHQWIIDRSPRFYTEQQPGEYPSDLLDLGVFGVGGGIDFGKAAPPPHAGAGVGAAVAVAAADLDPYFNGLLTPSSLPPPPSLSAVSTVSLSPPSPTDTYSNWTPSFDSGTSPVQSDKWPERWHSASSIESHISETTPSRGPSPLRYVSIPPTATTAERAPAEAVAAAAPPPPLTPTTAELPCNFVCLAPQCEAQFPKSEELDFHTRTCHTYTCHWVDIEPCQSGSFATRNELNWHVKSEHLLVCPVLGCVETGFRDSSEVSCHVKWAHRGTAKNEHDSDESTKKNKPSSSSPTTTDEPANVSSGKAVVQSTSTVATPQATQTQMHQQLLPHQQTTDPDKPKPKEGEAEKVLKMNLSIATSKKRCWEQLRKVAEKKAKRTNANAGRMADSPGSVNMCVVTKLIDSLNFPVVWEHGVLPFLIEFIPKWCGPGHVISVMRGNKPNTRKICFMTKETVPKVRRVVIAGHVRDLLPESYRNAVSFSFTTGVIERIVWARGLGAQMPDEVCPPRNPFHYENPCMGDSIGITLDSGEHIAATLGPCLTLGGGANYWLSSFHPFYEANPGATTVPVEHPSPMDRVQCKEQQHEASDERCDSSKSNYTLGDVTATSGYDLKTTRLSHDPYWEENDKDPQLVVTDWALITAGGTRQANILRRLPTTNPRRDNPLTATKHVVAEGTIYSAGRTSGFQKGQVCEVPAYMDGHSSPSRTGKATREWYIEEPESWRSESSSSTSSSSSPPSSQNENEWIRGGIGVPGDSGAAVVDATDNALVGQLWGRNSYWGGGPRITYFTPIHDILDDVQEKCGEQGRPQLPQYRDEADCWPVYPSCRQCFDLSEYLNSRRSSAVSMLSMIGGAGEECGKDHDLTSDSELATPKDVAKTPREEYRSYIPRYGAAGDPGVSMIFGGGGGGVMSPAASFNSVLSPAPIHTFGPAAGASPAALTMRSPYAQVLDEEDLWDTKAAPTSMPSAALHTKRSAAAASTTPRMAFAADITSNKRQRTS